MVDCRPAAAASHEMPPHNGVSSPPDAHPAGNANPNANQMQQRMPGGSGDMPPPGVTSPSVRASTPAANNAIQTYPGMAPMGVGMGYGVGVGGVGVGGAPLACGMKGLVWCAPPPPFPPPPGVNPNVFKSMQPNGADLPMNDIATLRYYFNLGVECMWAAYGHPQPQPPRHYSPRDIAQEMQQMSLHERPPSHCGAGGGAEHHGGKHKQGNDKPNNAQHKPQPTRPLLGPRFKRGGNNQDGNQNSNHNQNKGHNNNMGNKGPNHRRNSTAENRGGVGGGGGCGAPYGEECAMEPPLVAVPFIPYPPPPLYPLPYYPVENDPAMMGMMGGMGYVSYEEGVEYAPMPYMPAPPHAHPHAPYPPHHHHVEHK